MIPEHAPTFCSCCDALGVRYGFAVISAPKRATDTIYLPPLAHTTTLAKLRHSHRASR